MAKLTGGILTARALRKQGITTVFTIIGTHIWPILDACPAEGIRVIDVRHEQAAAFAADGWARITGNPGAAIVTAGPGVTNTMTAVTNAFQASSPALIIGGHTPTDMFNKGPLQELDHVSLMRPVTKWADVVYETTRIPEYINTALRYALVGRPGPVFLACPENIILREVDESSVTFPEVQQTRTHSQVPGNPELVKAATKLLAEARSPAIIAGSTIFWSQASEELQEFVERLEAPLFLSALARGCLSPEHPLLFVFSRRFALGEADVILILGAPLDFRLNYGQPPLFPPQAKVIQVDIDQAEIGHNRPVDIGILGDAKEVLRQFNTELAKTPAKKKTEWINKVREVEQERDKAIQPLLYSERVPLHPLRVLREVRDFLDKDATVIGDGGDFVTTAAGVLRPYQPGHWLDTGKLGCLGVGTGFALAAKLARPDKQVLLVQGDGTFGLSCMEFDTAVRHNLPFVSVIGNNGGWGGGYEISLKKNNLLGFTHYEKVVEALGGYGEFVDKPEQIQPALKRAFDSGVPAAVNVVIDPYAMW